jgi:hypothetical protein
MPYIRSNTNSVLNAVVRNNVLELDRPCKGLGDLLVTIVGEIHELPLQE